MDKKSYVLRIRLTEKEKEELEKACLISGLSKSELSRIGLKKIIFYCKEHFKYEQNL